MQGNIILFGITIVITVVALSLLFGLSDIPRRRTLSWLDVGKVLNRSDGRFRTGPDFDLGGTRDKHWLARLITQMKSVPNSVKKEWEKPVEYQKHKRIVIVDSRADDPVKNDDVFSRLRCPISQCTFSTDNSVASLESADAILFRHNFKRPQHKRPPNQLWVLFLMESPFHSPGLRQFRGDINWTASYRVDSTIYMPYGLYRPFNRTLPPQKKVNFASGKTKMVAWVASHCRTPSGREQYVKELAKNIQVDSYGRCGMKCPKDCFDMLKREYKFYLSFENSLCHDYITEKMFHNALSFNMIPVVRGAPKEDYERLAPPGSFIHVDDYPSPKALAEYLHKLDKDDELYNSYFKWKELGVVYPAYTYSFYCRFCAELWADRPPTRYDDVNDWWRGKGVCMS